MNKKEEWYSLYRKARIRKNEPSLVIPNRDELGYMVATDLIGLVNLFTLASCGIYPIVRRRLNTSNAN